MIVRGVIVVSVLLAGCGVPSEDPPLSRAGRVQGEFSLPVEGDAWFFLFPSRAQGLGEVPRPAYSTAVPRASVETRRQFVFGSVLPNPWRLTGFLDVQGDLEPFVDVLSQPTAGDWLGEAIELNLQPGRTLTQNYSFTKRVAQNPPAFEVLTTEPTVRLDFDAAPPAPVSIRAATLDAFGNAQPGFRVRLLDANNDGVADDANGDMIPDVSLNVFLHWRPRPGQAPEGTTVIVPMLFNPAPFFTSVNGRVETNVVVNELQLYGVPQAREIVTTMSGMQEVRMFGSPPPGEYELVLATADSQFWLMPNQLGPTVPSQATRFFLDRTLP